MRRLWTPWRSTYITAKKDHGRCIFCEAAASADDRQNFVVYRGKHTFIMLNKYPYTSGHLMIAPYEHVSRLADASSDASAEMMQLMRRSDRILHDVYRPGGVNLGMNLGEAAGAGIEQHIHMHALPRWTGDANFMTTVANTRVLPEALEDTYAKLHSAFS